MTEKPTRTIEEKLARIEREYGMRLHPSYRDFLLASVEFCGGERRAWSMDELVAWPGVSMPSAKAGRPNEDTIEYWLHDLAELWGIDSVLTEVDEEYRWSRALLSKGYPIGVGYDGSLYIQSSSGDVYHTYGDEWLEDEDHAELAKQSTEAFFKEWGHHHLANDFRAFYRMLCERRGANG